MTCPICGNCNHTLSALARAYYKEIDRKPLVTDKERKAIKRKVQAEAIAARREFHARKRAEKVVVKCPDDGTVISNDQIVDGSYQCPTCENFWNVEGGKPCR